MAAKNYGPHEATLLASAARTETTNTDDQMNDGWTGLYIFLNVTAVPGGDTVGVVIQAKAPVGGSYAELWEGPTSATTGLKFFGVYPGIAGGGSLDDFNGLQLPRTWRISVVHSGAGSFTYSLAVCMLP